jgi:hypothetical protein
MQLQYMHVQTAAPLAIGVAAGHACFSETALAAAWDCRGRGRNNK